MKPQYDQQNAGETPYQSYSLQSPPPLEILRISIKMDPNDPTKTEQIVIYEGDEPRVKAEEFAKKNGFGEMVT